MRAVVTRVTSARVDIDGETAGSINGGLLVLLGVHEDDTTDEAERLAGKITQLRIFEDEDGKMNLSAEQIGGSVLVVSQFTLLAKCKKGRRPDFTGAARPEKAIPLYEEFVGFVGNRGLEVQTGRFGAEMQVYSCNDGPVTIVLDTDEL